ncbi:mitochondrial escape protein 2 [Lobulomyces angularis]|nr:mitochondrial escape protein 2 [Lobulomyces angularis]
MIRNIIRCQLNQRLHAINNKHVLNCFSRSVTNSSKLFSESESATGVINNLKFETALSKDQPNPFLNKGTLWFDNVFPLVHFFSISKGIRLIFLNRYARTLEEDPSSLFPTKDQISYEIVKSAANIKEGGIFVDYKTNLENAEFIKAVNKNLVDSGVRSYFNFNYVRAHHVVGTPFIEDMLGHLPEKRLKVEFEGPDVPMETLYTEFRKYGRILDIITQPKSCKDLPRFAMVQFASLKYASNAKNCLHGEKINETRLSIQYEKEESKGGYFKWLFEHPKISVPILLVILAGTTYLIFDPLRAWFVTNEMTKRYHFTYYRQKIYSWWSDFTGNEYVKPLLGRLGLEEKSVKQNESWKEREKEETRLKDLLKEIPQNVILISGPRGCGKSEMIEHALKDNMKVIINCDDLVDAPSDYFMLSKFSKQVGFYPELSFLVSFGDLINGLMGTATGTKATNVGTTVDSEVEKILGALTCACINISKSQKKNRQFFKDPSNQSSEAKLELTDLKFPVIVIEGFMTKDIAKYDFLYEMLTVWAQKTVADHLAHVIFVSNNPGSVKYLDKASSNAFLEKIILNDAPLDSAMSYVKSRLGLVFSPSELLPCVEGLGGRKTDLELLVQKIKIGMSPQDAYNEIILKSVTEIRKIGMNRNESDVQDKKHVAKWNIAQFWKIVELLSKFEEISYDDLRYHAVFGGDEMPLQYMENSGLINIFHSNGRPTSLKAGRPVYRAAFGKMMSDKKLVASMGVETNKILLSQIVSSIEKLEKELLTLIEIRSERNSLTRATRNGLESRIEFIAGQLTAANKSCMDLDEQTRKYKENLQLKTK